LLAVGTNCAGSASRLGLRLLITNVGAVP
jgi:hypothetical protein